MSRAGSVAYAAAAYVVMIVGGIVAARLGWDVWQTRTLGASFLTVLALQFGMALAVLAVARVGWTRAGIVAAQPARWLEIACMALAVMGPLGGMAFGLVASRGGDPRRLPWALALVAAYAVALPLLGWFLRRTRAVTDAVAGRTPWALLGIACLTTLVAWLVGPHPATTAAFLLVLVGIGEELFFRGALQSLLDRALGTPWRLFGAEVGWGWVVQAVPFGLAHPLVAGRVDLLGWGLWTAAAGLCFGWLRARSGTILAPALVHGVLDVVGLVLVPLLAG